MAHELSREAAPPPRDSIRVDVASPPHFGYAVTKRAIDITVSLLLLVLLAPVLLVVAITIKLGSRGPVFFSQERVGAGGSTFRILKFRSMVVDAEQRVDEVREQAQREGLTVVDAPAFKAKNDPRVTRIGSLLRRSSLDEIPQLLNVLVGQMSLVGPRPLVVAEARTLDEAESLRHAVKPGITCIWQTSGRNRIPFDRRMQMDVEYVHRRSLWLDIVLMIKTPFAVFSTDGAY